MADYTTSEIISILSNTIKKSISIPVMETNDCPAVIAANKEFNSKFTILMGYWEPFQAIFNICSGSKDGSTPNSFNAKIKQCEAQYPCSDFLHTPNPGCTFEQITQDGIAHGNCFTNANTEYEVCVRNGINNNSLSYYSDKILEYLNETNTAYNKLQVAIRDCRIIKNEQNNEVE